LIESLVRPLVELFDRERAQRMTYDYRLEIGHAESLSLYLRFVEKDGRYDYCARQPRGLEPDGVVRTARRARPSITDSDEGYIVLANDPFE
jgi:hypothetical protein